MVSRLMPKNLRPCCLVAWLRRLANSMIKRIFKVTIDPARREAFENDFGSISVAAVDNQEGFVSLEIGKPTRWNPNEYSMISNWADESSLVKFAGENWNRSVIPGPMEKYVLSCSVEHFLVD